MELRLHTPRCRRSCRTSSSGPAAPSRACSQKRPLAKRNLHATLIATAGAAAGSTNLFFITLHTGQGRVRKKMQALYAFRLHLLWRVTAIRHRWCQDGHRCVKQTNNTSEQTSKQVNKQTKNKQTYKSCLWCVYQAARQSKMASVSLQRCVELQPGDRDGNIVLQRCGSKTAQDAPRRPKMPQDLPKTPKQVPIQNKCGRDLML